MDSRDECFVSNGFPRFRNRLSVRHKSGNFFFQVAEPRPFYLEVFDFRSIFTIGYDKASLLLLWGVKYQK